MKPNKADTPPSRPKRPRTQLEINEFRRQALIDGTIRSLAENGVAGTTVSTICAAAGSSRGLLNHYYSGKDDLMVAALQHLFGSIAEAVRVEIDKHGSSAVARLRAMPGALYAKSVFTELNRTAFLSLWHETRFNAAVRKANQELYNGYVERTEALFRDAARELDIQIDHRRAALGLIGLTDGLWLGMSIYDAVVTREQALEICSDYIRRELRDPPEQSG